MSLARIHPVRRRSRALALALVGLAAPLLLGGSCGGGGGGGSVPLVVVSLDGVPGALSDLLVAPPHGFALLVRFPEPESVEPGTLSVSVSPWDEDEPSVDLTGAVVEQSSERAVIQVPASLALPEGTHTVWASVDTTTGGSATASRDFAVRERSVAPPLEGGQWIHLDATSDRDGDGRADLREDLEAFGLGSAGAPSLSETLRDWVVSELVQRTEAFYASANPLQLSGGDAPDLVVSDAAPASGPATRICVGGEDPTGGVAIGNVLYDAGNGSRSETACSDAFGTGIFPRELQFYDGSTAYREAFDPLLAEPVGTHALDPVVLSADYDPDDAEQRARFETIERGVVTFAQAVATVSAHEAGHAVGLVPPGEPGGGLFGGSSGQLFSHNVAADGTTPSQSLLLNAGSSFSFAELAGAEGAALPRLRATNHAYLRGRLILDDRVTELVGPPEVAGVAPQTLDLSTFALEELTVTGEGFRATPSLRLLGPVIHPLTDEVLVDATELTGLASTPEIAPGTYDLELTNPDGQADVLPAAVVAE